MNNKKKKRNNYIDNYDPLDSRSVLRYQRRRKRRIKLIILKTVVACATLTLIGIILAVMVYLRNDMAASTAENIEETTELSQLEEVVDEVEEPEVEEPEPEEEEEEENSILKQVCFESEMLLVTSDPTSICLEWADAGLGDYYVLYRAVAKEEEKHGKGSREDGSASMSTICTCINEANDTGEENEANGWIKRITRDNKLVLEGLEPDTTYHVHIGYADKSLGEYVETFEVNTMKKGYCDPFKAVFSLMSVSQRDEETGAVISRGATSSVQMTSGTGCEGVVVKPMFDVELFNRASKDERNQIGTVPKGTKLVITPDEGNYYCYYDGSSYKISVMSENRQYDGWIDARTVLIDMNKMFTINSVYSMQFDRTNAYSSIFTAGGDAQNVELEEPVPEEGEEVAVAPVEEQPVAEGEQPVEISYPDTRYNPLFLGGETTDFLTTTGYNGIDGITGLELKNYESKDYMPVIWDLAMELKQCQKNALENGYTIKMYEGYRPLSTSNLVYNMLNGSGSLALVVNETTLAQGYITSQAYNVGNYIGYRSRHNRGVATDLTLVKLNSPTELGEEAHMQTKMHTLDFRCNMAYNTWEADLLTDIMIGHNSHLEYLGLRQEWWHFQLKNSRKDLYPLVETYGYEDFAF